MTELVTKRYNMILIKKLPKLVTGEIDQFEYLTGEVKRKVE